MLGGVVGEWSVPPLHSSEVGGIGIQATASLNVVLSIYNNYNQVYRESAHNTIERLQCHILWCRFSKS